VLLRNVVIKQERRSKANGRNECMMYSIKKTPAATQARGKAPEKCFLGEEKAAIGRAITEKEKRR